MAGGVRMVLRNTFFQILDFFKKFINTDISGIVEEY